LPDTVVVLFIPNEQNLRGLEKIVRDIRSEGGGRRRKEISLQFVMSNVPDLDDEDNILRERVKAFRHRLGIEPGTLTTIHRYDSLALLAQVIFTKERPKSRLAREYRALTARVRSLNTMDAEGALAFIRDHFRGRILGGTQEFERRLEQIREAHPANVQVLHALARVRIQEGRPAEAESVLEQARQAGASDAQHHLLVARALQLSGNVEAAASAAVNVFDAPNLEVVDLLPALEIARNAGVGEQEYALRIGVSRAIAAMDIEDQLYLATMLRRNVSELNGARYILDRLHRDPMLDHGQRADVVHALVLSLVGLGAFSEAAKMLDDAVPVRAERSIENQFNYAMARWGVDGAPRHGTDGLGELPSVSCGCVRRTWAPNRGRVGDR
jgi:tetratricopeptide (TPR) repeat protein